MSNWIRAIYYDWVLKRKYICVNDGFLYVICNGIKLAYHLTCGDPIEKYLVKNECGIMD